MKNIVGKVRVTNTESRTGLRFYLNKDFTELLGDSIIFLVSTMIIKRPNIDSHHTYSIKNKQFSFPMNTDEVSNFVGSYKVIQQDEDTFKLKKIKNNAPYN